MSESNATSLERLDSLLQEGKINREEYETLRGAMASKPSPALSSSQPRRWAKSWKNRQLGGVCAGIAESLGVPPSVVRIIFVVLCFLSLGVLGVLLYVALCFALPWDEEGRQDVTRFPWGFALLMAGLIIGDWLFFVTATPRLIRIYADLETALPMLTIAWLRCGEFLFASFTGGFLLIGCWLASVGLYMAMPPDSRLLRVYRTAAWIAVFAASVLFALVISYSLWQMTTRL